MFSSSFQRSLLQGENADLELYRSLRQHATGELAQTLDTFIATEMRHAEYWRTVFHLDETQPNLAGKVRNAIINLTVRLFGSSAAYLLLEAVETHGINKYLEAWDRAQDDRERKGLRTILEEEFFHEDEMATGGERRISPEAVRNAFLGFNDGSVELLGTVSGLSAALSHPQLVAVSALTVSIAGSLSMAVGAFLSTDAEREMRRNEHRKRAFNTPGSRDLSDTPSPFSAARTVGIAYLFGAALPVIPFLLGSTTPVPSILLSGTLILAVSAILAFLSGQHLLRRVLSNAGLLTIAVLISFGFGQLAERFFSIY